MNKKRFLVSTITALLGVFVFFTSQANAAPQSKRLGGQDRIETSAKIATDYNDGQLQAVVVTTSNDFPEALTGSTLAAKYKAPILLVDTTAQGSQKTLDYIKSHLASNGTVYILGQTSSVSTNVENAIKNMGYTNIKRLEGSNKAETLKIINNEVNVAVGTPVFIASGDMFPDALSASGVAASKGYPIILCSQGVLPQTAVDQLQSIKPSQVYIAGGSAVVPDSVIQKVMNTVGIAADKIVRLYGQDRYATSLAIDKKFNLTTENAIVASGQNFPDALAGSSLATKYNAPIILTDGDFITDGNNIVEQKKYLDSINCSNLIILGGEGVVSKSVEDILSGYKNYVSKNGNLLFWVTSAYTSNNKNYITGYFDRFVYHGDSDLLYAIKEYEKESGYKIGVDNNGELGYEGFNMHISTPVTLEVADNVVVSVRDASGLLEDSQVISDFDFNYILQRDYKMRSVFEIIFENGIVTKIIDNRVL